MGDDLRHAPPVVFAGSLQMPDLHWDMGFTSDLHGLVDRLEHGVAFGAHMGGVDAAERRRGAG
jgi:hypothetical protein